MSTLRNILFVLSAAGLVSGQAGLATLPACGQSCVTTMFDGASLNCPASDLACLCASPNFGFGIRDCASSACGAAEVPTFTNYASSICATVTPATSSTASILSTSASTTSPSITTVTTTSTGSILSTTTPLSASSAPAAVTSTTATPSVAAVVSTSSSPATTNPTSSAPASSSSASSGASSGLSTDAKIGISVGSAVGALAVLGVLLCVLLRRRRSASAGSSRFGGKEGLKISQPMPGAGRAYAPSPAQASMYGGPVKTGTGTSELEATSRRYEDMVPRHQPRTMV